MAFNSQGTQILTASADKTARIWDAKTGQNLQVLEGHTDEIFSCSYNYEGNIIITGEQSDCILQKMKLQLMREVQG